ncbi:MAG: type II toxin-antitoxin system Phd/YefM family antitoxin [Candidatus Binatia bacterium]
MTHTISSSQLKAHCSQVIDEVVRARTQVIITKRGRPVAKLAPIEDKQRPSLFGFARGHITVHGDITGPIDVDWEAAQ